MPIKEQFRYNGSIKEYQIITDFSKGINTADGDSILTDNTARNVTNFDIDAGAILTKRHGVSPLKIAQIDDIGTAYPLVAQKSTVDDGNDYLTYLQCALVDALSSQVQNKLLCSSSFFIDSSNGEEYVEVPLTATSILEYLKDKKGVTHTSTPDVMLNIAKILFSYLKVKEVSKITQDGIDVIVYHMIGNDLIMNTLGLDKLNKLVSQGADYVEYIENPNLPALGGNVKRYTFSSALEKEVAIIAAHSDILFNAIPDMDIKEQLITANIFSVLPGEHGSFGTVDTRQQLIKITDGTGVKYVLSSKSTVPSESYAGNVFYINAPFTFKIYNAKTLKQKAFIWDIYNEDYYMFSPDADTFNELSYNLLTMSNLQLAELFPENFTNAKLRLHGIMNIPDTTTTSTTLSKPILVNYPLPYISKSAGANKTNLAYLVKLIANAKDTTTYHLGYQLVPLDVWTAQQYKPDTFAGANSYMETVVKPALVNANMDVSKYNLLDINNIAMINISVFETKPQVLQIFAIPSVSGNTSIDAAVAAIKSPTQLLTVTLNINPVQENISNKFEYDKIIEDFKKTDKDLFVKNQVFRYGGSNKIYVSDINNSMYYPMNNYLTMPTQQEIVSVVPYYNSLLVQTKTQQFIIEGTTPSDFKVKDLNSDIGAYASLATKPNINYIFQLAAAGVYRTKSTYNFADRYNVDKMDNAIAGDIPLDKDACAIVHEDKYYLHTPSTNEIWIYYNQFNSWVRHYSELFRFKDMFVVDEQLVFAALDLPGLGAYNQAWVDSNYDANYPVVSIYKSKEVDFGLPNHDKKFKEMHVAFEDTPKENALYVNGWVDGTQVIAYQSDKVTSTAITNQFGQDDIIIHRDLVETNQIETISSQNQIQTIAQAQFDNGRYDKALFDNDINQVHKVIISGRGKAFQFEVIHKDDKQMKIRNFGFVLKNKKPKARYKE